MSQFCISKKNLLGAVEDVRVFKSCKVPLSLTRFLAQRGFLTQLLYFSYRASVSGLATGNRESICSDHRGTTRLTAERPCPTASPSIPARETSRWTSASSWSDQDGKAPSGASALLHTFTHTPDWTSVASAWRPLYG